MVAGRERYYEVAVLGEFVARTDGGGLTVAQKGMAVAFPLLFLFILVAAKLGYTKFSRKGEENTYI